MVRKRNHAIVDRVQYPWWVLAQITGLTVPYLRQRYRTINYYRKHKDMVGMAELTRPYRTPQINR